MHKSKILVTCAKGIPSFLIEELRSLDFPIISETKAGVFTEGTIEDSQRLNLMLRTGHRVLFFLKEFTASDAEELYRETFLFLGKTISLRMVMSA